MSSFPASTEEDAEYNNICEKHKHLIETLPKGNGWMVQHLYNYNGFWFHPDILKSYLVLQTHFEFQPTDIILASFIKSGTTWLKALMFSTLNRHHYSFTDHYLSNHSPQSTIPFLETISYPITHFSGDPRLFATHLAHTLLPSCTNSCKFIYICRDPKDVLISKWHFMNEIRSKDLPPLSLNEAFELFCKGVSENGPFWEHVLSYWKLSLESPDKILLLKYDELKKKPEVMLRRLAAFMGTPFTAEEEKKGVVGDIVKLCSFKTLSNLDVNKSGVQKLNNGVEIENRNYFRKGEIGDWKNYLSEEMKERIDGITYEKLKGSGLIITTTV